MHLAHNIVWCCCTIGEPHTNNNPFSIHPPLLNVHCTVLFVGAHAGLALACSSFGSSMGSAVWRALLSKMAHRGIDQAGPFHSRCWHWAFCPFLSWQKARVVSFITTRGILFNPHTIHQPYSLCDPQETCPVFR